MALNFFFSLFYVWLALTLLSLFCDLCSYDSEGFNTCNMLTVFFVLQVLLVIANQLVVAQT